MNPKPSGNRPLNLRQIEVFHAIMTTGSLSAAGRLLYVSQPAISRVLASAENRLGYSLFERIKGRLYPTREAQNLFQEVDSVYQGMNRVNDLAVNLADDRNRTIRIMSSPTFGEHIIPDAFKDFLNKHPNVQIKYQPITLDFMLPQVLIGHTDIAISMLPPPQHPDIVVTELDSDQVYCVIPREHKLAKQRFITPQDIEHESLISYGRDTPFGSILADFLQINDNPIPIKIEVRSSVTACRLVKGGLGVALVDPYCITQDLLQYAVALPLKPVIPLSTHLLHSIQTSRSNLMHSFLRSLRKVIRSRADELLAP